jgi:hypothetical protein
MRSEKRAAQRVTYPQKGGFMSTAARTHPWWVAGLAALAAAATVCVLALAGAFANDPIVVEKVPVLVVKPTTGGID